MNRANYVDYLVIALYALLMVLVGFYVMRFNRGASEYFRGGSRIPRLVAGLSCFMSGFSAWTFTGGAGVAYRAGIAAVGLYIGNALRFLLGYFVFAVRWRFPMVYSAHGDARAVSRSPRYLAVARKCQRSLVRSCK